MSEEFASAYVVAGAFLPVDLQAWWRLAHTPVTSQAMSPKWFEKQGLQSFTHRYLPLRGNETAVCDNARTVV